MITSPRVAIIVLNWNGLFDTLECLESVKKLDYPNLDVIVVDNASSDGSPKVISERSPEFMLIENENNLGYAEGNNVGIQAALARGADYLLLLNNDAIIHPQALNILANIGESRSDVGLLSPKIVYYHDPSIIWAAGMEVNCDEAKECWLASKAIRQRKGWFTTLLVSARGHNEIDRGQHDSQKEVNGALGCALLAKRELIQEIGLLDPIYFLLLEDADWSIRASRAGYKTLFVPEALVLHKASRSLMGSQSPPSLYYSTRNTLLFARKHAKCSVKLYSYLVGCGIFLMNGLRWLLRRDQGAYFRAKGVADFWLGRLGKQL